MSVSTSPADRLSEALSVIRPDVRASQAYAVATGEGLIKLDIMENPFALPADLQRALAERLAQMTLNRYPAASTERLRDALSVHAQLPEGCALTLGNGSDELIQLLTLAVSQPGGVVMSPAPSFVMYGASARQLGLQYVAVDLREDWSLDEAAMLAALEAHRPALLYFAYPNNPTGNLWDADVMERLIVAAPGVVVIDEAYQPFAQRDARDWLVRHPHVLVMRTLSKFGLAGVRVGYLMGRSELVAQIEKLRPPFNISVLNAEAACFALAHEAVYQAQAEQLKQERARVTAALQALPCTVWPSEGNMVLVRVADAPATFNALKARGILVKSQHGQHPLLTQCLRITIGTHDENTALIHAMQALLSPSSAALAPQPAPDAATA